MIYCPRNLDYYLQKLTRSLESHFPEINNLYQKFCDDIKELIIFDITNNVYDFGKSVCGDSCCKFLSSDGKSCHIDITKIKQFIETLEFPSENIESIKKLFEKDKRNIRQIAKGHFQTSFVINLLMELYKTITQKKCEKLSTNIIYAALINCHEHCKSECTEDNYIKNKVEDAIQYLKSH